MEEGEEDDREEDNEEEEDEKYDAANNEYEEDYRRGRGNVISWRTQTRVRRKMRRGGTKRTRTHNEDKKEQRRTTKGVHWTER